MRPVAPKAQLSTSVEVAEALAVSALSFLGEDAARLETFLSATGLGPHNLRKAAATPGFYASVLAYIASDEQLLIAFASDARIDPAKIAGALHALGESLPGP